jgi:hypothetical protein
VSTEPLLGVEPNDPLARFLLESGRYTRRPPRVKKQAFMPSPQGDLSVFDVRGLSDDETASIGREWVAQSQGPEVHGWATVLAETVEVQRLSVNLDNSPPRHANIVGWPVNKEDQKLIAQALADAAQLVLVR